MHIMIHGSLFLAADQRMLWLYSREAPCASCLFVFLLFILVEYVQFSIIISSVIFPLLFMPRPLLYLLLPSGLIRMDLHSAPGSEWIL